MEFFIKQNTDLPLLKMQIVKDGKQDYKYICDLIERSAIYFSMIDDTTGNPKIVNASAGFVNKVFIEPNSDPEYYLYYRFNKNETNRVGRYRGEFTLVSDQGTLIVPIADNLFINIPENLLSEGCDDNCGDPGFPCCDQDDPLTYSFDLNIILSSGSIIVDYELTSDKTLITLATCSFTTILETITGDTIQFETELYIQSGEKSTTDTKIINENYDNLTGNLSITNFNLVFEDRSISYSTEVKSPNFNVVQQITDAILTNIQNEYIQVGINIYLSFK